MRRSKVILRSVKEGTIDAIVEDIFNSADYSSFIPQDAKIVIKVNLSTPFAENAAASNTSPEILEAVCRFLKKRTDNIVVGESDGMRYRAEEAFEVSGYYPVLDRYGVRPVNFSKDEWVETGEPLIKGWGLPRTLLEADVFITLPVLKTHATTVFTGSLKNQFGCYPQNDRILLHPRLDEAITLINRILKPRLGIMDGIIAMEGRGPINGRPRRLDVILGSTDVVALDATAMRLIGLDPYSSGHVALAEKQGLGNIPEDNIEIDGDFNAYKTEFEHAERDLPIKLLGLISHSKFLTEKLIINPEAFYPLRKFAVNFRKLKKTLMKRDK